MYPISGTNSATAAAAPRSLEPAAVQMPGAKAGTADASADAPAPRPALPLEFIVQKEQAYFRAITPELEVAVAKAGLQTSDSRAAALGRQLMYITNPCAIGALSLSQFRLQHVSADARGYALVAALPAPGEPQFGIGSLAYQVLLGNDCAPKDDGLGGMPLAHAARFLTLATQPR
ncbi:hypothetical protein J7J08_12930 [Stenotrophomonas sp. ISL-67]|uniref:hypothetical protein n=1 Tax=Stenotrophomonas sp. ISL-67 TaxID=2819171 RepID=UPI001BE5BB37|nr:hypothetical protein [Stenotrophomonas sp. ISL-67]MBT2768542.1 hypothetical protein [Stenotrophomonas sp. ISL-67]